MPRVVVLCAVVWLAAVGCVEPTAVSCSNGVVCPPGNVCDAVHGGCASRQQVDECAGHADLTSCSYPGVDDGACFDGVCLPSGCGNGSVDAPEVCDDGNRFHGDGCSADCMSTEVCGNGVIDRVTGESCDDGNTVSGDGCQASCVVPTCGDGIVDSQFNEACDEGSGNSMEPNKTCRPNCQLKRCGDHVVD